MRRNPVTVDGLPGRHDGMEVHVLRRFEEGSAASELVLGYVSTDSYKFGEYTGSMRKGIPIATPTALPGTDDILECDAIESAWDSALAGWEGGKHALQGEPSSYDELPSLFIWKM